MKVELVSLLEGQFHRMQYASLEDAATFTYEVLANNHPQCEALHSITVDGQVKWKYEGAQSLASLFKIIYPEGVDKRRRMSYD